MLTTILAWIYISFLCFTWGTLFLKCIDNLNKNSDPPFYYGFSITCFIGLAAIGTMAQFISLLSGLGNVTVQLFFLVPAIVTCFFFREPRKYRISIRAFIRNFHPVIAVLLTGTLLMILAMNAHTVTHPDTVAYHYQAIRWAEEYKAVPGLVNINYLYGFQNSWFLLCALFRFSFTQTHSLTFINTSVLAWLLIFLLQKINTSIKKTGTVPQAFYWLPLFAFGLWSYTQVRLTATSASPDFIAAIYLLLPVYLLIEYPAATKYHTLAVVFLCCFTVTIKLSGLPVLLLPLFLLYPFSRAKLIHFSVLFMVVLVPYFTRNAIISGHLLFPSPAADVINTDWKYNTNKLARINEYILAYARTRDNITDPVIILSEPIGIWLPLWWGKLSLADKVIVLMQLLTLVMLLANFRQFLSSTRLKKVCIILSLAGIIFWLLKAPDPRFGEGFLLLFPSLVLPGLFPSAGAGFFFYSRKAILFLCIVVAISVIAYTTYRFAHYFKLSGIIYPAGIATGKQPIYYDEIRTTLPLPDKNNSDNQQAIPAAAKDKYFRFRGNTVTAGFQEK